MIDSLIDLLFTVQHECIPQAVLGMDILCQAKSGMGKTAVFVLATLQQLEATENHVYVLVMCHTRELAFQISKEYERFSKYMSQIKVWFPSVTFSPESVQILCSIDRTVILYFVTLKMLLNFPAHFYKWNSALFNLVKNLWNWKVDTENYLIMPAERRKVFSETVLKCNFKLWLGTSYVFANVVQLCVPFN